MSVSMCELYKAARAGCPCPLPFPLQRSKRWDLTGLFFFFNNDPICLTCAERWAGFESLGVGRGKKRRGQSRYEVKSYQSIAKWIPPTRSPPPTTSALHRHGEGMASKETHKQEMHWTHPQCQSERHTVPRGARLKGWGFFWFIFGKARYTHTYTHNFRSCLFVCRKPRSRGYTSARLWRLVRSVLKSHREGIFFHSKALSVAISLKQGCQRKLGGPFQGTGFQTSKAGGNGFKDTQQELAAVFFKDGRGDRREVCGVGQRYHTWENCRGWRSQTENFLSSAQRKRSITRGR